MPDSLLPPNATPLEEALEETIAKPLPIYNQALWRPDECPEALLPWLAHSLSVDAWDPNWPAHVKRDVVRSSPEVHRHKGTVSSIRAILAAAGYGSATITEGFGGHQHDGSIAYDGMQAHRVADSWAEYRVYLPRPITTSQAAEVRRLLKAAAPARCRLKALYFTEVAHTYNAAISHDGTFTYGAA